MLKLFLFLSFTLVLAHSSYSQDLGEKLCRLSVASYCNVQKVASWTCKPCLSSPIKLSNVQLFFNSTGDAAGLIGVSKEYDAIILVFRGTQPWDIKNWIEDINFFATDFPLCDNHCKVHRGFYGVYKEISQKVIEKTIKLKSQFKLSNIMVTGHSLGGALATHAVADLHHHGLAVTHFYTYGSPRVGDPKFAVWFEKIYSAHQARVTHGRDPVPHLPPLDFGFLHVKNEIFYKNTVKNGYKVCSDSSQKEDSKCSDQYLVDLSVLDHTTYYEIDFAGIILGCQ